MKNFLISLPLLTFGAVRALLYFLTLLVSGLLCNVLQFICLPSKPFFPNFFASVNRFCAYMWWGHIVFLMEKAHRIKIEISGDFLPPKEKVLLISNHQVGADIPALLCFAIRQKSLRYLKWFVKNSLKYVPCLGWGMLMHGEVFLRRDWGKDAKRIEKTFRGILACKKPVWIINFVEGTRVSQAKINMSKIFSKNNNRPVLNNVLTPKTRGFVTSVSALRHHLDAVYDVTIGFPEGRPNLKNLFLGYCKNIKFHVKRYPIEDLPYGKDDLDAWLWKRFVEKDHLMNELIRSGSFLPQAT